jgi:hypothetical protein
MLFMPEAHLDLTRRVLVPINGSQPAVAHAPRVRRYRLARLPLHTRQDPMLDRFDHLRRSYD